MWCLGGGEGSANLGILIKSHFYTTWILAWSYWVIMGNSDMEFCNKSGHGLLEIKGILTFNYVPWWGFWHSTMSHGGDSDIQLWAMVGILTFNSDPIEGILTFNYEPWWGFWHSTMSHGWESDIQLWAMVMILTFNYEPWWGFWHSTMSHGGDSNIQLWAMMGF